MRIITSNSTHRERIRLRNRLRRARVSIPTADRKHRRLIDVNFLAAGYRRDCQESPPRVLEATTSIFVKLPGLAQLFWKLHR